MKKILIGLGSVILIIGAFVIVTITTPSSISNDTQNKNVAGASLKATKEDAQELISQTMTREEIEENLGPAVKFVMSSEGCERGVYEGIFSYEAFIIYSRTYDKGKTYTIVAVN